MVLYMKYSNLSVKSMDTLILLFSLYTRSLNLHHLMMKPHVPMVRFVILYTLRHSYYNIHIQCPFLCIVNSIIGHYKKHMAIIVRFHDSGYCQLDHLHLWTLRFSFLCGLCGFHKQRSIWSPELNKVLLQNRREKIPQQSIHNNCCFEAVAWVSWGPCC